jgi:hypothetical protein
VLYRVYISPLLPRFIIIPPRRRRRRLPISIYISLYQPYVSSNNKNNLNKSLLFVCVYIYYKHFTSLYLLIAFMEISLYKIRREEEEGEGEEK